MQNTSLSKPKTEVLELWVVALLTATAGFLLWEFLWVRTAFSKIDELNLITHVQMALEGGSLQWTFATGSLARTLQFWSARLAGSTLSSLHLPILASLLFETVLLFWLIRRLWSSEVAAGAVFFNLAATATLMRGRSLLSWGLLPLEMLLLGALWLRASDSKFEKSAAMLAGFLSGLFLMDYEGWVLALPVMVMLAWMASSSNNKKPMFLAGMVGLAAGLLLVVWFSFGALLTWFEFRTHNSLQGGSSVWLAGGLKNLKAYFGGGDSVAFLGLNHHPALPPWSWPFLALGLVQAAKNKRWLLLWLFIGMAPIFIPSNQLEPNRAIVAWTAWCLLAGLGWQRLWNAPRFTKAFRWLCLAMLVAGTAMEWRAWTAHMEGVYSRHYGSSESRMQAAAYVKKLSPIYFATNLDGGNQAYWRFLAGDTRPDQAQRLVAIIPDGYVYYAKNLKAMSWRIRHDRDSGSQLLLEFSGEQANRFAAVDKLSKRFWREAPRYDFHAGRAVAQRYLDDPSVKDPWLRTMLYTLIAGEAAASGNMDDALVETLLSENFVSADPLGGPGLYTLRSRPDLAKKLLDKAALVDPRATLSANDQALLKRAVDQWKAVQQRP